MQAHPALADEQAYLDDAYDLLERGLADAEETIAAAVPGDRASARALRRALEVLQNSRGTGALIFGRADTNDTTMYVGRRRVYDQHKDLRVVSWHAPAASLFYEATPDAPHGLTLKRTFVEEDRRIVRLIDEILAAAPGTAPVFSDALLAELERSRDGAMRDVVATIQAEQFNVIRAPNDQLLVVQGGPGTGKTVVGLHRAAWLAYNDPALRDKGMLVVTPSATLLSYISGVLPLLGVSDVLQVQISDLYAGDAHPGATADPAAEALKGSERMAHLLHAALQQRIGDPAEGLEIAVGADRIRLTPQEVSGLLDDVRGRTLPHNEARTLLRQMLSQALHRAYAEQQRHRGRPIVASESTIRRLSAFSNALDRLWPTFSPEELLRTLYSTRSWLVDAATGILTVDERAALARDSAPSVAAEPWTEADLYCLDELAALLDGPPITYGHIVVDEAQDLSPMQARALARRCPSGAVTLLGDLAQARNPWTRDDWEPICRPFSGLAPRIENLTIGYRVPASALDLAALQLPLISPALEAPRSIRPGRFSPQVLACDPTSLTMTALAASQEAQTADMSVGVIVTDDDYDDLLEDCQGRSTDVGDGRDGDFAHRISLVPASLAKGLEFDAVVIIEPAAIIGTSDDGRRALYCAMTRCTQALYIVHALPLPAGLDHLDTLPKATAQPDEQTSPPTPARHDTDNDLRQQLDDTLAELDDDDVRMLLAMAQRLLPPRPRTDP